MNTVVSTYGRIIIIINDKNAKHKKQCPLNCKYNSSMSHNRIKVAVHTQYIL